MPPHIKRLWHENKWRRQRQIVGSRRVGDGDVYGYIGESAQYLVARIFGVIINNRAQSSSESLHGPIFDIPSSFRLISSCGDLLKCAHQTYSSMAIFADVHGWLFLKAGLVRDRCDARKRNASNSQA